jgi:hypothetical protein
MWLWFLTIMGVLGMALILASLLALVFSQRGRRRA